MMAYPNLVSCEEQVMLESKLAEKHFKSLPKKNLKGLQSDFTVFEFKEIFEIGGKLEMEFKSPILGRNDVLLMAHQLIAARIHHHNRNSFYSKEESRTSCLVIRGELEEGKTRVLKEIYAYLTSLGLNCLFLSLCSYNLKTPYYVIRKVFREALKLKSDEEFQKVIAEKLADLKIDEFLHLLNPIFNTNFPSNELYSSGIFTLTVMRILCNQIFTDFQVILIDDAELIDLESFKLHDCFLNCSSIFTFMALGHQRKLIAEQKESLKDPRIAHFFLDTLDKENQTALACNCLKVDALSPEFERFLHFNSDGVPGWIETYVEYLLQQGSLDIKTLLKEEVIISTVEVRDTTQDLYKVAFLKQIPNLNLSVNGRNDNDMMLYDSLSTYEQLVCKCASVMGVQFTRHMLFYIMSSSTNRMIGKALMKLFELRILMCASKSDEGKSQRHKKTYIKCNCENPKIFASCRDLPKFSCCMVMEFQRERFRNVVYNSLTEKQRIENHGKALLYLHMETKQCDSCGKEKFSELILQELDFQFRDGILDAEDNSFESMVAYFESINLPVWQTHRGKFLGIKTVSVRPVVLNYLNYNFRDCKCTSILLNVHKDMIKHCHGGHNTLKLIHTKVQLARINMNIGNFSEAHLQLTRALSQLDVSF